MQSYSTEYLQQIINPLAYDKQVNGNTYMLVIAASYAFKLSSDNDLILYNKALSEISDTIGNYNIGLDEGLPKHKSECIIFGKNIVGSDTGKQEITLSINKIKKSLSIYPKRNWVKQGNKYSLISEGNLESIFISYENTYGGKKYKLNPDGFGYNESPSEDKVKLAVPQIELSNSPIIKINANDIIPGSFSTIPIHWPQRTQYYGKINQENPTAIPIDINPIFFQSSPIDQQLDKNSLFSPGEKFSITGMSENQFIEGTLPDYKARIFVKTRSQLIEQQSRLDTIIFFPNEDIGFMTFRAIIPVKTYDAKEHECYVFALDHSDPALQKEVNEYKKLINNKDPEEISSNIEKTLLPEYFKD